MQVTYEKNKEGERQVDLFALGRCLGITDGQDTHRIELSASQWQLLADSAQQRAISISENERQRKRVQDEDEGDDSDDPTSVLYEGHRKDQEAVAKALARDKRIR